LRIGKSAVGALDRNPRRQRPFAQYGQ
jgi:hypothetical protein